MPNGNNLNSETFVSKTKIYLIIIAILMIVICVYNYRFIPIGICTYTLLIVYTTWTTKKRKSELSERLKDLTLNVNTTAKTTLINSPFPLVMAETNGNVIWKSEKFVTAFENVKINDYLGEILSRIKSDIDNSDKKEKGNINTEVIIENCNYQILGSYVKSHKTAHLKENEYTTILYFIDQTYTKKLEKIEEENDLSIGIIMIDNYEEISQRISSEIKPQLIAKIEQCIYKWASKYDALIIKSDRDTFYCIIEKKNLENAKNDKLSILDDIKNISIPDAIQATLSIAFSNDGNNDIEKADSAKAVLDIALGRGGDQAIVKNNGKYEFFGGRTQEIEKRTKVKARIVSHALKELILESDNVIIMGHSNGDMDSIGSAMGVYRLTKTLGKEAKIVNETSGIGIDKFIDAAKKSAEYEECFVTKQDALGFINDNTLLVVVDTNKKTYVEAPDLLESVAKVVVIDHHRRSTDYIENAMLTFHEVYASSTAELVTEILEYSQTDLELTQLEIEALYAGIMLDTKNFTFKTGVRTFEAAAYLRKCGVDIIKVKKWFQSDLETYQTISEIVSKSEIVNDTIAISIYEKEDSNANIVAAKAADELLSISGITASFVLGRIGDKIYISGRSIGDINVQLILEKLGGGGHITLAGAQIENMSIEEAKQELINRINEYMFETEN